MPWISRLLASVGLACDYYADAAMGARERARCLNLQVLLDDGSVGLGDCLSVIRSGTHGRCPAFDPERHLRTVVDDLEPRLRGLEASGFRAVAERVERLEIDGRPVPPALMYGLSQALLGAAASARKRTMAEVLTEEYGLERPSAPVAIFGCADRRHAHAMDGVVAGGADVLPHGGFTTVASIGAAGEKLLDFVASMSERVRGLAAPGDLPVLHVDVYGTIGQVCDHRADRLGDYLHRLADAASPLVLRIEDPVGGRDAELARDRMRRLVALVDDAGLAVEVVADEHCNTREDVARWVGERAAHMIHVKLPDLGSLTHAVEAVLLCRGAGVGVYVGGTMNDTDVAGRVTVHLALATQAEQVMAKPGVWPEVSLALTRNEMNRTLQLCASR